MKLGIRTNLVIDRVKLESTRGADIFNNCI